MTDDLEGFAVIPRAVQRDSTLSATAKLVYLALSSRANAAGQSWPSIRLIAEEASTSERSAHRALAELEERRLVTRSQRRKPDGGLTSSIYTLGAIAAPPAIVAVPPNATVAVPPGQSGMGVLPEGQSNESHLNESHLNEEPLVPGSAVARVTPGMEAAQGLCDHLSQLMVRNGVKKPTIGKTWLDAARLAVDVDGHSPAQLHRMIEWSQNDEFWRANIQSMSKLREKYDTMKLRAAQSKTATVTDAWQQSRETLSRMEAQNERTRSQRPAISSGTR